MLHTLVAIFVSMATIPTDDPTPIHVSGRNGDDGGDGSPERPFKTIRRALALFAQLEGRRATIHLDLGHFGKDTGETFPIRIPDGVRLVGFGSTICEIAGLDDQPVLELPASGALAIESVALRGGTVGLTTVKGDAASQLSVELVDVLIERCPLGVELRTATGALSFAADGLRVREATLGLGAAAAADLTLALDRCEFRRCHEAVVISCEGAGRDGPFHAVTVRGCRFDGNEETGLVRRGDDPRNRAPEPWRVESSAFLGSRIGLALEIPSGDVPFVIRDCDFEGNANLGFSIVGSGKPLEGASRIEGCRLRWNGVGAQLLTMGRRLELVECRFEDSIGIGLNFGNFVGERSRLAASGCLFARNGAAGFFGLCERENGIEVELDRCTIADNRGNGVERKNRKRGSGPYRISRCVIAGNAADLVKIDATEAVECAIGGDPRFVDRIGRDWRLAPDSPARSGAAEPPGAPDAVVAPPAVR